MPEVMIDGVAYLPAEATTPRIGIAVTVHNRFEATNKALAQIRKRMPQGATLVVVDDGSSQPYPDADFRFAKNVGIARAKNKCLELLMQAGVDHLFLFDNDTYPLVDDWWEPYVTSREPHLMWTFLKPDSERGGPQLTEVYRDEEIVGFHATRGCMLYVERRAVERVGGMDPDFGKGGWEHQSWSDRIHAAGLTTCRYMDVVNSEGLIYSMDQHEEVKTTWSSEAREFSEGPGLELRTKSRHSDHFIEYREREDVVLTCLLAGKPDPQRNRTMSHDPKMLAALQQSLKHDGRFMVLTTGLSGPLKGAELVDVPQAINPYFERWVAYYRWLRDNPQVGRVWCVDGTDVQMTRDPFPEMESGTLYMGYEPTTLRDEWMLKNHDDTTLQEFMKSNPNLPLLNMGLVGGDRETAMDFAHKVSKFYFDDHIDWIFGWEHGRAGVGDMAVGNYVARTYFADRLSSGPHVTNVFKSEKPSQHAWWKHK